MSEWNIIYDGLSRLGVENTGSYRGYVVRVGAGHWFTYAHDNTSPHTYWIGQASNEEDARKVLERLGEQGWLCEVYVNEETGHCPEPGAFVRHTYHERKRSRVRIILCHQHKDVFPDWELMETGEYIRTYNELEQDRSIIGGRIAPKQ